MEGRRILLVGAGGIGCEILKTLVLMNYDKIDVVDMDTIELSNLNRQFLFKRKHVGRSKSIVAVETVLCCFPERDIKALISDVTKLEVSFFYKYCLVFNALDNKNARSFVNKMCVAVGLPLVESGSAGYLGQVCPIIPGLTECYDCNPKPAAKTFPGCTIRNTPSEFIHCVVWAKALFNQLFGMVDPLGDDDDVSPEQESADGSGDKTITTRMWAERCKYNPEQIFKKVFSDDIHVLLAMSNLWIDRVAPVPITLDMTDVPCKLVGRFNDMHIPDSVSELAKVFFASVPPLASQIPTSFDKDHADCLNFVYASANLRAMSFHIPTSSRFDVKSKAGNIIPAIASTNAMVASLAVHQARLILGGVDKPFCVFVKPMQIMPMPCQPPNPDCFVCGGEFGLSAELNTAKCTVEDLRNFLASRSDVAQLDLLLEDGRLLPEDPPGVHKTLSEFGIGLASVLTVDAEREERYLLVVQNNEKIQGNTIVIHQKKGVKRKRTTERSEYTNL